MGMEDSYPGYYGDKGKPEVTKALNPEEEEVVSSTWESIKAGQSKKRRISKEWGKFYRQYAGKHWDSVRPEWMSEPVINYTFSTIETILPILTDSRPQISVVPFEPDDVNISNVLTQIVDMLWEFNQMDTKLPKVMKNTLIFGNGFVKVDWDASARNGLGEIRITNIDPEYLVVDPEATDTDNARWMAQVQNVPLSRIKENPVWASRIEDIRVGEYEPEYTIERSVASQSAGRKSQPSVIRNTDGSGALATTQNTKGEFKSYGSRKDDERVTLAEVWKKEYLETGAYYIRKIVVCNNVVLEDTQSPLGHNMFPFVHFPDYALGWQFWAMGEVQQVEKLQQEINRRRGLMLDIMKFTAMPLLVVDPTSGVDYENMVSRPGMVVPAIGGMQAVGWLHPPSMPGELFAMNDRDKQDFDSILGNVDVLQGRRPTGIEAAAAIEALNEAANTRMRLKVRYMESALRQVGLLMVKMVQKFYTTERIIRVAGRDGFTLIDPNQDFMKVNEVTGMDEAGNPMMSNPIPQDAEFDVRIASGSTLPVSRQSRYRQAMEMFINGAIDQIELLKSASWPRWEEVVVRMQQMAMAAQATGFEEPKEEKKNGEV